MSKNTSLSGGMPEMAPPMPREYLGLLNNLGGSALRLVTTAIVAAHPDTPFSLRRMYEEVHNRQGTPLAWELDLSTPLRGLEASTMQLGIVERTTTTSRYDRRIIRALQAVPSEAPRALTFCGAMLGWAQEESLPLSFQSLFGKPSGNKNQDAPEVRHRIYRQLPPGRRLQLEELYAGLGIGKYTKTSFLDHIEQLANLEVLSPVDSGKGWQRRFTELSPLYAEPLLRLCDRLGSVTTRAADFQQDARDFIDDEASFHKIMALAYKDSWSRHFIHEKGRQLLEPTLLGIIQESGGQIGLKQAFEVLAEQGRPVNIETVRAELRRLETDGKLQSAKPDGAEVVFYLPNQK